MLWNIPQRVRRNRFIYQCCPMTQNTYPVTSFCFQGHSTVRSLVIIKYRANHKYPTIFIRINVNCIIYSNLTDLKYVIYIILVFLSFQCININQIVYLNFIAIACVSCYFASSKHATSQPSLTYTGVQHSSFNILSRVDIHLSVVHVWPFHR